MAATIRSTHGARLAVLGALLTASPAIAQLPVSVQILPVDLQAEPARYRLRVDCGDRALANVAVGLILPPNTSAAQIDFGGCFRQGNSWTCANAQHLGDSVNGAGVVARLGTGGNAGRTDTLYARFPGISGGLCSAGKTVDLVEAIAIANLPGNPKPRLVATTQRIDEELGAPHALTTSNLPVPIEDIRYQGGAGVGETAFLVRPSPASHEGDPRFEVSISGSIVYQQLTLGLILPQGISAAEASFGNCTQFTGGNLAERSCSVGSRDLGVYVDAAISQTVGPAPGLANFGARTDTLYLVLRAENPDRGLNVAGIPTLLGVVQFSGLPIDDLHDYLPPLTDANPSVPLPSPEPGFTLSWTEKSNAGKGTDTEGDDRSDPVDLCPHWAESVDSRDVDGDRRGDECECTDQTGDGRNNVADLPAINRAIFNPHLASPLCDGNNDGLCNVADIVAANVEIFSPTNTSTCARQPVPGPPEGPEEP